MNETEYDTYDIEQRNAPQGAQVIQLESSRLVPVLVVFAGLGLVLSGLALGVGCWSLSYADKARMEARVLQVKVEGFENALHSQGIDPDPHLRGQDK